MKISHTTQKHAIWLISSLIVVNIVVWITAIFAFYQRPGMLGMSLLAWSLGLRHAVDADHIAAIDTTTRKMMEQGKEPIAIGTFFSLGHSTIVMLAAAAIAVTVGTFKDKIPYISNIGGTIGTSVSILFLLIMAYINLTIFISVY
ncbi:HoxN/HupN/NixA family nickel/cobalt transporter, partial [Photobacterium damselae]|nr:HoxN/HupN/NixA family nickel/cobalt transporter [Photobacterium damselae]